MADLMSLRRRVTQNAPHLATASGNVVTFNTDMTAPLKSLKVYFTPVQSGSGDPSPENVRPISGWDSITVTRDGNEFYPARTLTVTFPQTLYGGYVDLVSGDLIKTVSMQVFSGNKSWSDAGVYNEHHRYASITISDFAYGASKTDVVACNWLRPAPNGSSASAGASNKITGAISSRQFYAAVNFCDSLNEWMNYLSEHPLSVAYNLRDSVNIFLTPQSFTTLKGQNTIWSTANGIIEAEYWTH